MLFTLSLSAQVATEKEVVSDNYAIRKSAMKEEAKSQESHWYLKTNTMGLAMLIANAAVEIDLSREWSVNLPVYYSAWDYFGPKTKFRTFLIQPELRYWVPDMKGLFVGAHLGMAWFNYALGGEWRYQDHDRHTPILGGGLSAGYRQCFSKDRRWFVEFSLGAGVYALNYDKFRNEPNGKRVVYKKGTYIGIDHVAISFAYQFDLKKKK